MKYERDELISALRDLGRLAVVSHLADAGEILTEVERHGLNLFADELEQHRFLSNLTKPELKRLTLALVASNQRLLALSMRCLNERALERRRVRTDQGKKGGEAKARNAKAKPHPEKDRALDYARRHPGLSALQIKQRAKLRAAERTIRVWLSASC